LSQGDQTFRFELNESIYFEKGQEVAEMKGISLDPDITIEPYNDYISIRGVIELQGEYQKKSYEEQHEDMFNESQFESRLYVERVLDADDGEAVFVHRFPVEISVPTYRITDLNDVTVYIDSFDYELPEENHLRLYSTIEIHGIHETMKEQNTEVVGESRKEDEPEVIDEKETFHFEIKEEQDEVSPESSESLHTDHLPVMEEKQKERTEEQNMNEGMEEQKVKEKTEEKDRWKYKETKTLKEFFSQLPSSESESSSVADLETESSSDEWASENESSSMTYEISSDDREEEKQEDVEYLSEMFRGEEEDKYAKLRLCIVQEKDTIESIADRYDVTALQLIKQNGLDHDFEIRTGQLLYIPD